MELTTSSPELEKQLKTNFKNFADNRTQENNLTRLIKSGLEAYNFSPDVLFASFYFLDKDTFEFYFGDVIPAETEYTVKEIFASLVDNGIIGEALSTGEITFYPNSKEKKSVHGATTDSKNKELNIQNYYVIIPVIGIEGVLGITILCLNFDLLKLDETIFNVITYFSDYFSCSIDNLMLFEKQNKNQSLLDQIVASRTISLVESKVQLGEKIENLKSNLSMSIPHEVRTPINQILGFTDYLIKHFDTFDEQNINEAREILVDIKDSAIRLRRLFENYLYYANLTMLSTDVYELQKLQEQVTPYSEPLIFDKVLMMSSDKDRKEDVQITLNDSPIAIGEEFLNKIIEEIMDNCLKYSQKGSPLIVGSEVQGEKLVLFFKDFGRGMSKEQIENIDAYMQFERNLYEQQGSGLGLTIVRRIIDLHRGEFFIESENNKYTAIILKLPIPTNFNPDNY